MDGIRDWIVNELNELLKPNWGAEKWILEGWNKLNNDEQTLIKGRMHDLFKDGLPFELKHDKLLYIYTFSFLAQLEVLAIQVPLRFEETMPTMQFKQQMHTQLLDEVFHGLVFTKIVYMLCAPFAFPPAYNKNIEIFCDFIRNEGCPKVGVVLLNLVAEGWLEGFFKALCNQNIAPRVMSVILEDETRHVQEADLYHVIGLPEKELLREKLETLEELMLTHFTLELKYFMAFSELLGKSGTDAFYHSMNENHIKQLKKIKMVPSKRWQLQIPAGPQFYGKMFSPDSHEVELTPARQMSMTQWNNPGDPTMVGQFNIDVSCLDFYSKKYPSETLTTLMMQAVSQLLMGEASFRTYLSFKKLYQSESAFVAVVVRLPDCGAHTGTIIFKNCHQISAIELASKIRHVLGLMVYCYKKREEIEKKYLQLKVSIDEVLFECAHGAYPYPIPGNAITSVSNIGAGGFSQVISPLRRQEALKFTLLAVERKPTWNNTANAFEAKDILPVSMSSDHRVFDGHWPIQKLLTGCFQQVFQKMLIDNINSVREKTGFKAIYFRKMVDHMLSTNLQMGYQMLVMLQTNWPEYMNIDEFFNKGSGVDEHDASKQHATTA